MLVCPDCFEDKGLKARIEEIRPQFNEGKCDYHNTKKGVPVVAVAEVLKDVIENNYHLSGYGYDGEPTGELLLPLIEDLARPDQFEIAEELQNELINLDDYWPPDGGDPFFADDTGYTRIEQFFDDTHSARWQEFRSEIMSGQRFFSRRARDLLSELFDGLHLLRNKRNVRAVRTLKPSEVALYRGRKANVADAQSRIRAAPEKELGPPPEKLRGAGRMNPSGIPVFYGAEDIETCLAELRPAVGETVMVARFRLTRPVVVLDTTLFASPPKQPNIFAKSHNERLSLWGFMAEFMSEISMPCLPDDEHLDYVPTQVVAEYLVHEHLFNVSGQERHLDGLIFQSAQKPGGKNIVLFGPAGLVETEAKSRPKTNPELAGLQVVPKSVVEMRIHGVSIDALEVGSHLNEYDG
ncbi:RES domain-containing protein [Loktanella sp. D2R18]|uniref:RES domain-containing protein n=1 Tax=Rhodobacterales TaxID=204455 RepID=UPI000DE85439|nr:MULTISPECIES: RES domain-containing protein [Rhodobacterales]MDO6591959.1 RES domain-containing protein [Yoonia sp. 1_MG-2023]RBW45669.1 RES domain-containing protein [Loktanella sp. D2R18]